MKTILIILSFILTGCSTIQPPEYYDFTLTTNLPLDQNGYYHYEINPYSSGQSLHKFAVHTNNPITQMVYWDCDTQFSWNDYEVDIINHWSYTDEDGDAFTMFGPNQSMINDTVTVYTWYTDSVHDVDYQGYFKVILK